ncbi:metal-dependent hydrolase family protein [Thermoactinospora rubra]|uniref:metal-dependent hydrolase family protein n=1 Tax=Thermoactinospora rubra TaxID=1088767 RepID=UPI000A122633|nr:amidohydrolase family protein [Thermoactinospora rubra]
MERITADLLIPGDGDPVRQGTVVVDDGVIVYAGPSDGAPPADPRADVETHAPVVMPGLWDCHGHLFGLTDLEPGRVATVPMPLRAARCVPDLRAALDAGVTSVREVGGLGVYLAPAVADGSVEGPSIYPAGAILSATGGHGDLHGLPHSWVCEYGASGGELRLADGPDECARAVREQLRRNAKVIKICASGGVLSDLDHPIHQQFTFEEMRAIVEVAAMAERSVAAHCHGKPGMIAALEAGVRTIEHGTFLDEEVCDLMREKDALLVATRTIIDELITDASLPPIYMDKLKAVAEVHADAVALAHSRGVKLAMGTDIFVSGRHRPNSWGRNGRELVHLVDCGLSPLEAIRAATAHGPLTLGAQAPRSGILAEGYDADLITLAADPLADISVLADPANVTGVWKAGRRVKSAAKGA